MLVKICTRRNRPICEEMSLMISTVTFFFDRVGPASSTNFRLISLSDRRRKYVRNRIMISWLTALTAPIEPDHNKPVAVIRGSSTCTRRTPGAGFGESVFASSSAACSTLSSGPGAVLGFRSTTSAIRRAPAGNSLITVIAWSCSMYAPPKMVAMVRPSASAEPIQRGTCLRSIASTGRSSA